MKKIGLLFISILVIFAFNDNVNAKENFYQVGSNLNVSTNFNSSVFFAGENVTSNSTVKGISVLAGNSVTIGGTTEYGILAGNDVKISSTVNNDLFVGGSTITINDATLARDTYIAGSDVVISQTKIGKNIRVSSGTLKLSDVTIKGNLYVASSDIEFGDNVVITGKFSYNEDAKVTGLNGAKITKTDAYEVHTTEANMIASKIKGKLFSVISGFILLTILFLLFPNIFKKVDYQVENNTASNYIAKIGIGFIGLFMVPILSIVCMITIIGLPVGLILLFAYALSLYLGALITAYVIGNKLNTITFKKEYNFYTAAFLGLIIINVLELIPIIGGFIALFSVLFGFGLIMYLFFKNKKGTV